MLHCDLRVRWKVASDLRFRAAIPEPQTLSFCGISGDLAQSTRKSLAIAIVRFWCAKSMMGGLMHRGPVSDRLPAAAPGNHPLRVSVFGGCLRCCASCSAILYGMV